MSLHKTNTFNSSGINEDQIENYQEYKDLINSLGCCICLCIVKSPFECTNCQSLYCEECWDQMKIAGKKCVVHCTAEVRKANKFVHDMLNKLIIRCDECKKSGIEYKIFVKHIEVCLLNRKISSVEELSKAVKEKDFKILELTTQIENLKINNNNQITNSGVLTKEEIRLQLMTFNLQVGQKMELYNAAVEGKLNDFKNLITTKKYPILEEVSAHNYFWTPLHYAMHYGQADIVYFILEKLNEMGILENAMKLQSDDGRCPMLCLLRSNSLQIDKKKAIIEKIFAKYNFEINNDIRKEMRNRDMEYLLKKFNK